MSSPDDAPQRRSRDWLKLVSEEVVLPNGKRTTLDVIRHPGASAVVPFLSDDEVLLIQQYRFAAGGTIWEVPAGKLDPGESPETCAVRELEEETGYRAAEIVSLGSILTTPGFTDERIHLFEASGLELATQTLDPDEVIELVPMPISAALELVWTGQMVDGKSIVALLKAARRRGLLGH
jgi:ADP-ribose pyrophosphatase